METYKGVKVKTLKTILNAYELSIEQAFLVEKMLALTRTKKVSTISIKCRGKAGYGLWVQAHAQESFEDLRDFRKYLAQNDLPLQKTWQEGKTGHYILGADQIRPEFIVKPELTENLD